MYARNILTVVQHLVRREKGPDGKATGAPQLTIDMDDEITRESVVAKDGAIVHPRIAAGRGA
jgi:hypothetical protein